MRDLCAHLHHTLSCSSVAYCLVMYAHGRSSLMSSILNWILAQIDMFEEHSEDRTSPHDLRVWSAPDHPMGCEMELDEEDLDGTRVTTRLSFQRAAQ